MKWPSGVDLLPESVLAELEPGERPLCAVLATQFAGHSAIGEPGNERPRAEPSVDWNPLWATGITINDEWLQAKLGGVNAAGGSDSLGAAVARAFSAGASQILLTDRRIALIADTAGVLTLTERLQIVASVGRGSIAGVTRQPRLLQWGRVRIDFRDQSWAMAMLGMFSSRAARRLISAFAQGPAPR